MQIREMTEDEERDFFGRNDPSIRALSGAFVDGKCIAVAGVIRDPLYYGTMFEEDGRWIGFLQLADGTAPLGPHVVIAMRHFLKKQAEPLIVQCEDFLPKAEKLLAVLGFTPTDRYEADFRMPSRKLRIWKWQP